MPPMASRAWASPLAALVVLLARVASAGCPASAASGGTRPKWIVDEVFVRIAFAGDWWVLGIAGLFCLSLLVFALCTCIRWLGKALKRGWWSRCLAFPVCSSYFGIIYAAYLVTIPIFGRPAKSWIYPEAPHLRPAAGVDSELKFLLRLVYNGLWLGLAVYIILALCVIFLGICIIVPFAFLIMSLLLLICRMADGVDDKARRSIQGPTTAEGRAGHSDGSGLLVLRFLVGFLVSLFSAFSVTLKAYFDLLLLVSVSMTWPSIQLPSIRAHFDFDLPRLLNVSLPCLKIPLLEVGCVFTAQLNCLLILGVSTTIVSTVISSDIMVRLYDRINRSKMTKLSPLRKAERLAFFRHFVMLKALELFTFVCWKAVEVLTSLSAVALIQTMRMFLDLGRSRYLPDDQCKMGLYILSKLVTLYAIVVVAVQVVRVATGHVHRNLVYICVVPLTEYDYSLCRCSQLRHLLAVLRMSVGSFLMPFINLGIRRNGLDAVEEMMRSQTPTHKTANRMFSSKNREEVKSQKVKAKADGKALEIVEAHLDDLVYTCFGAGATLQSALVDMHDHQRRRAETPEMRARGIFGRLTIGAVSVAEYTRLLKVAVAERKEAGWVQGIATMVKIVFGIFDSSSMATMRALGRSNLWQSQIESVQQASGNTFGLAVQIIPMVGVFIGKVTMYLNEHPTWVMTDDDEIGERSFRWRGVELLPSMRLVVLYLFSVTKASLLLTAFFTGKLILCFTAIFVVALLEAALGQVWQEKIAVTRRVEPYREDLH